MDWVNTYGLWAAGYACYALGLWHGMGKSGWRLVGFALLLGLFWPAAVLYGIWEKHFAKS